MLDLSLPLILGDLKPLMLLHVVNGRAVHWITGKDFPEGFKDFKEGRQRYCILLRY